MALAIAGCGSSPSQRNDASSDAMPSSDGTSTDHPGADGGSNDHTIGPDGPPCFVPAECPTGMACCLMFESSGAGVVICQEKALCTGDGVSTFVACATGADCPAAAPTCTFLTLLPSGRDLNICSN